ncbi:MAG: hypothetical protein RBT80_14420 [Candidatus Vecturithrix sp.]|nr:hypothetical protein [Candidatus Vecturithrix sp.]
MKQTRFYGAPDHERLAALALQLRRDTVRMIHHAGSGHIGGALDWRITWLLSMVTRWSTTQNSAIILIGIV